jgi:hypothetical protein
MLMSIQDAAAYLGLAEESVRYLARAKRIPCGKVGRLWRFHRDDLDNFLRGQYQAPSQNKGGDIGEDRQSQSA